MLGSGIAISRLVFDILPGESAVLLPSSVASTPFRAPHGHVIKSRREQNDTVPVVRHNVDDSIVQILLCYLQKSEGSILTPESSRGGSFHQAAVALPMALLVTLRRCAILYGHPIEIQQRRERRARGATMWSRDSGPRCQAGHERDRGSQACSRNYSTSRFPPSTLQ